MSNFKIKCKIEKDNVFKIVDTHLVFKYNVSFTFTYRCCLRYRINHFCKTTYL